MNQHRTHFHRARIAAVGIVTCLFVASAPADELTHQVEQGLSALGYDPGPVDGTETLATTVAISKFQAQNDMEVTGEVSPELLARIVARTNGAEPPTAGVTPTAAAPAGRSAADLQAARHACLQQVAADKESAAKKKRGIGGLASATSRIAGRFGIGRGVADTLGDAYVVSEAGSDLAGAARDLGLTPEEAEVCRNP